MVSGYLGVITGFVTVWYENWTGSATGFGIGISVGGALQVVFQLLGHYMILFRKSITGHYFSMGFVFYLGCLGPGTMEILLIYSYYC